MMAESVVTSGLGKTYQEGKVTVQAVAGADLSLREGEVIGLFGPSGSGKTTLLSLVGCILRPTSGSLRIYDHEVSQLPETRLPEIRKKYISFIFQGFNLFPALTAQENVLLGLRMKGIVGREAEQRTREILAVVGLEERVNFLPRDLSGGQKQRVAVARALSAECPIILADEPTGNLDPQLSTEILNLLKDINEKNKITIFMVTHSPAASQYGNVAIKLKDGQVEN